MKKERPTLQDVADRMGVTKMAVSRFLRNPEQVSVALRGKIVAAPDELGYTPSRAPDILSNATSRVIGALLPSLTSRVFAEVLHGTEAVIGAHGYQATFAHCGYKPEMEQECLESMPSQDIDNLILTKRSHTPRMLKMIEIAGIPVVELMNSQSLCLDIAVGFDNFEATRQMTAAIIIRGYRHIAYPDARLDKRIIIKQGGCERAIRDVNLVPYSVMVEQSSSYPSGIELIRQAWREYPQFGGVFYTNGGPAAGVAFEYQRLGLKIPDDVAIVGFHGHDIGRVIEPRLVSVLTPRGRAGSIDVEHSLACIRGETVTPKILDLGFTLSSGGPI